MILLGGVNKGAWNMAAPAARSRGFQRSFSDSSGMYGSIDQDGDSYKRSISRQRSMRRSSLVGSLWNYLYASRRQSSLDVSELRPQEPAEESTDNAETECTAKQEDAWMQAYYNGVALVVLLVAGYICWAVYCVLEPFLHPLLWAVLVGTILHPFKKTWTERIRQWLDGLEHKSIPLSAGLVLSPVFLFNYLSKALEGAVVTYWHVIVGSVAGVSSLWLVYKLSIPVHLYRGLASVHKFLLTFEGALTFCTGPIQLATVTVGFILLLVITRSQVHYLRYSTAIRIFSTLVWFLVILNAAAYVLGSTVALPLVTGVFLTGATISFVTALKSLLDSANSKKSATKFSPAEKGGQQRHVVGGETSEGRDGEDSPSFLEEVKCSGDIGEERGRGELRGREEGERDSEGDRPNFQGPEEKSVRPRVSFGPVTHFRDTIVHEHHAEDKTNHSQEDSTMTNKNDFSQSDYVFLALYILFFMMMFWTYPFLLVLLVPFAVWGALKRLISLARYNSSVIRLSSYFQMLKDWVDTRKSLLLPAPLPTLLNLYLSIDRKILSITKGSVDSLISSFMLCGLLVSGLGLTVFLLLQIQVELSHYVTMMTAVWERTLTSNPQLAEWIGGSNGSQSFHDTFGSFASQGYMYGREWLANQVHSVVGEDSDKNSTLEKQVLNLYDQLYQSYVLANTSTLEVGPTPGMKDGDLFNELKIVVMDNLETVISVLKSTWSILSDNLSLAVSLLYAVLGLLLSGGTALLNAVIFLTTLFYLLCYSADVYLPVKVVLDILPSVTQSDTAGQYTASFSRAIRSVFHASIGRLVFYGLYTWLVHTAFSLPVSILPAVLAAVAGALPFIGPYWIALPAILELWLVEGQTVSAITVLILSLLPPFFVDSIIYGEVEGGHPYLTGLAVAGGIYFAGLEGALIGPILLCCLVFIHELLGELFTHTHDITT